MHAQGANSGAGGALPGVYLPAGASAWETVSDQTIKENRAELDYAVTLAKVTQIPIYSYNYIGAPATYIYRGPMAQDWHAQFPSGKNPLAIDTVDLDGISLACIRALAASAASNDTKIALLEATVGTQAAEIATLETDVTALETTVAALQATVATLQGVVDGLGGLL